MPPGVRVCITGPGKVRSAVASASALAKATAERVVNIGTAGALRDACPAEPTASGASSSTTSMPPPSSTSRGGATRLYLMLDGVFKIEVDGDRVAEVGPGAVVGERATLEGGRRSAAVRALTNCRVAVATGEQIERAAVDGWRGTPPRGLGGLVEKQGSWCISGPLGDFVVLAGLQATTLVDRLPSGSHRDRLRPLTGL